MPYYRKITGERLYLSPFDAESESSYAKWADWMNDRTVSEYYGGYFNVVSLSGAKKTVGELKGYRFDIVLLKDGVLDDVLIGHVSLHDVDHLNRHAFLGICIGEGERRNRGYGGEAVRLTLDYGFNTLNLHNIMLSVQADNLAAIACYKKAGFIETGRRREWVFKDGGYVDVIYMGILAREFEW